MKSNKKSIITVLSLILVAVLVGTSCVFADSSERIIQAQLDMIYNRYENKLSKNDILCGSDGRQGYLYHVCVAKEYRRRGIGTHMVGFCMHQLKAMGINKVALIAFTANDVGNAFWKQIGWNRRADVYYYDFVLNEKNITRFIGEDNEDS